MNEKVSDIKEVDENEERVIENVYRLDNNTMLVLDQYGEEMPEYQGNYEDMIDKINKDKPEGVEILFGVL